MNCCTKPHVQRGAVSITGDTYTRLVDRVGQRNKGSRGPHLADRRQAHQRLPRPAGEELAMAKRRTKRSEARARRRASKEAGMNRPGCDSSYARKKQWLDRNGAWGFDVPHPKPWKAGA